MSDSKINAAPTKDHRAQRAARLQQLRDANDQQHIVRYFTQTAPPLYSVDPDEIERLAGEKLNKEKDGAYAYVFGAAGLGSTHKANRAAFDQYKIIPRMLVDNAVRDLSTTLFGVKYPSPLILGPVGVQGIVHADAEIATARAAAKCGVPFCLSTAATRSIETVVKEVPEGPKWYQLYWPKTDDVCVSILQRAKASGYKNLIITLDTFLIGWRPMDLKRGYLPFHHGHGCQVGFSDPVFMGKHGLKPMHNAPVFPYDPETLNLVANSEQSSPYADNLRQNMALAEDWMLQHINSGWFPTWKNLEFVKQHWDGPIILKGIMCVEDAELALDAGVDGIVVSNHGGRQVDGGLSSLDALVDIMKSSKIREAQESGKFTILFDSGIRSGPDVVKALALGAQGVLIGRLYMYGLALKGEVGVEAVIKQLLTDVSITMGLSGYKDIESIRKNMGKFLRYVHNTDPRL